MTTAQLDISPPGKAKREIQIPKGAHAGLRNLFNEAAMATNLYQTALNATVAAMGLDPELGHSFDVASGVITVNEEAAGS